MLTNEEIQEFWKMAKESGIPKENIEFTFHIGNTSALYTTQTFI